MRLELFQDTYLTLVKYHLVTWNKGISGQLTINEGISGQLTITEGISGQLTINDFKVLPVIVRQYIQVKIYQYDLHKHFSTFPGQNV